MEKKEYPNELTITGNFLGATREHREWTKDGVAKSMDLDCCFMQCPFGVAVVRSFNNTAVDFSKFKVGEPLTFPVEEYRKENGIKAFTVRF